MNLNQGGRVNFNQGGPGFYNQADRELYAGGLQYLPQEQYRLNLGNNNQVNRLDFNNLSNSGITSQAQAPYVYPPINKSGDGGGGGEGVEEVEELHKVETKDQEQVELVDIESPLVLLLVVTQDHL